jgi:hypothetical protein
LSFTEKVNRKDIAMNYEICLFRIEIPSGPGTPAITIKQVLEVGAEEGYSALTSCPDEFVRKGVEALQEMLAGESELSAVILVQDHASAHASMKVLHVVERERTMCVYADPSVPVLLIDPMVFALVKDLPTNPQ